MDSRLTVRCATPNCTNQGWKSWATTVLWDIETGNGKRTHRCNKCAKKLLSTGTHAIRKPAISKAETGQ